MIGAIGIGREIERLVADALIKIAEIAIHRPAAIPVRPAELNPQDPRKVGHWLVNSLIFHFPVVAIA
jgi:hypothetical protein